MNLRLAISLVVLLMPAGCPHRASAPPEVPRAAAPLDLTSAPDSELHQHLGETVTMHGMFSLRGKVGPYVLVLGRPVYLEASESFKWGEPYTSMEGKDVRVTGTLRFIHYPEPTAGDLPVGRPSDHFYFDAKTARIELSQK